jgi:hypothetical protein
MLNHDAIHGGNKQPEWEVENLTLKKVKSPESCQYSMQSAAKQD